MINLEPESQPSRDLRPRPFSRSPVFNDDQLAIVRTMQRARLRRGEVFAAHFFGDPAWDMLLELYAAHLEQRRISIGRLSDASGVAGTTVLRWLDVFQREGLVERVADRFDGRRIYVSLSRGGIDSMSAYFATLPVMRLT
jgi:DNA-binding MarR family transcriptional regulator